MAPNFIHKQKYGNEIFSDAKEKQNDKNFNHTELRHAQLFRGYIFSLAVITVSSVISPFHRPYDYTCYMKT